MTKHLQLSIIVCKNVEVDMPTVGYCVKCRINREMKDAQVVTMKNGKPATQGECPVCGTKMFRIGGKG